MTTIEKISLDKIQRTYTMGFNYTSTVSEFSRIVYFTNGAKISVMALLSEIGNNGLDSWNNVEKIKRSSSNKNIQKYLSQFLNQLNIN
jgi:hypothetical protein